MTTLRTATLHDLPGVYRVCLQTGLSGHDATGTYSDPDLLGHIWAGPYLVFPDAVALVLQDDRGVAGYCVGVPDTMVFEQWVEDVWLPPLRDIYPPGSGRGADAALVDRLHHPTRTDAVLTADHPAHLHIDLLPRVQGHGWGRRLMDAVTAHLRAAGAGGVHLGVDEVNTAAQAFYRRMGWTEVRRTAAARYFARSLEDV